MKNYTLFVFSVSNPYFKPHTLPLFPSLLLLCAAHSLFHPFLSLSLSSLSLSTPSMASISGSSVSLKARPQALLKSSSMTCNYGPKSSVSFLRTGAPSFLSSPLRLRISCAAKPDTVEKVSEIVKKQLALKDGTAVTGETKFSELGADSLDTVEIVMRLEEEFGVCVEEENAQTITTIGEAADLIEKLQTSA